MNYKNYTFSDEWLRRLSLTRPEKVSQKKCRKKTKNKTRKKTGTEEKLILAALLTIPARNYALTFCRDTGPTLAVLRVAEQEDVSSRQHDEPAHSSTGSQSTSSCREVP